MQQQGYATALHLFTAGKDQPEWPAWWYTDLSGGLQGPFDPIHMLKWCQDGVLPLDLQCCGTAYPDKATPPPPDARFQALGALLALVERGGSYTPHGAAPDTTNPAPPSAPTSDQRDPAAVQPAAASPSSSPALTPTSVAQQQQQQQQQQEQEQEQEQEGKQGGTGSSAPPPRRPETRVSGGIVSTLDPKAERYVPPHMRSSGSSDTALRPDQGASGSPGSSGASLSVAAAMHPAPGPFAQVPARHPWSSAASVADDAAARGAAGNPHALGPHANASQPLPTPPAATQHVIAPLLPLAAPPPAAEPSEGPAPLSPAELQAAVTKLFKHEGAGGAGPELKWRVILASGDRAGPFTGAHMLAWSSGGDPPPGASRNKAGPAHACLACGIVAADYNAQRLPGSKFYKPIGQLLAAASAGVRYEPVTKHDLARGYPPRGWNEAGSAEGAGPAPPPQQQQQPPLPASLMPSAQRGQQQQQGRKHNTPQRNQQQQEQQEHEPGQEPPRPQRGQQDKQKQREQSLLRNQQQREAREAQQQQQQLMQQQLQQLQLQQRQQQLQHMQQLQQSQHMQHPQQGPGTPMFGGAGAGSNPWAGPGAANAAGLPPHLQAQLAAQQAQMAHQEQLQQLAQQEQERQQHERQQQQQRQQQRQHRMSGQGGGLGPSASGMSSMPPGSGAPGAPGSQYAIVDVGGAPVLMPASVAASLPAASASVASSFQLPMRGMPHGGGGGGSGGLMPPAGLGQQQHMQQQQQQQQQQQHMRGGPQMMGRGGAPGGWQGPGGPMQGPGGLMQGPGGPTHGPGGPLHGAGGPMPGAGAQMGGPGGPLQGGPGGPMQGGPMPGAPPRAPQRANPAALLLTGGQALPELFPLWFVRRGDGPAHGPLPAQALLPELMGGAVAEDATACCVTPAAAVRMHTVGGAPPGTAFVALRTLLVAAAAGHVLLPWRGVEDPAAARVSPMLLNTLTGTTLAVGPGAGHAAGGPAAQNQPLPQHVQMQQQVLQMQQMAQQQAQMAQQQQRQQEQGQQGQGQQQAQQGQSQASSMAGGPQEPLMPGAAQHPRMPMSQQQQQQQQQQQGQQQGQQRQAGAPAPHHPGLAALTAHVFTAGGLPPQAWPVWFLALNPDGPVDGPLEAAQVAQAFNANSLPLNTPVCGVARALLPQLRGGPPREAFQPLSTLLLAVSRGEGLPAPLGSGLGGSFGGGIGGVGGSMGSNVASMAASNGTAAAAAAPAGAGGAAGMEDAGSGSMNAAAAPGAAAAQENGGSSGDDAGSAADGVETQGAAGAEQGTGVEENAAAENGSGEEGEAPAVSSKAAAVPEHSSWGGLPDEAPSAAGMA